MEEIRFLLQTGIVSMAHHCYTEAMDIFKNVLAACKNEPDDAVNTIERKCEKQMIKCAMLMKRYGFVRKLGYKGKASTVVLCHSNTLDLNEASRIIHNTKQKCSKRMRIGILNFNNRSAVWQRAKRKLADKRFDDVIDEGNILQLDCDSNWNSLILMAECYAQKGNTEQARNALQPILLKGNNVHVPAVYISSLSHFVDMNMSEAEYMINQVISIKPDEEKYKRLCTKISKMSPLHYQAEQAIANGKHKDAVAIYGQMLALSDIYRMSATILNRRAESNYELGEYHKAFVDCNEAALVDDTYIPTYITMANVYLAFGMYNDALDTLRLGCDVNPEQAKLRTHFNYLDSYIEECGLQQVNYHKMFQMKSGPNSMSANRRLISKFIHPDRHSTKIDSLFRIGTLSNTKFNEAMAKMDNEEFLTSTDKMTTIKIDYQRGTDRYVHIVKV